MILGYIILATFAVSLISLIGVLFIGMRENALDNITEHLVSF